MSAEGTLLAKIWARHRILEREDGQTLLYVDRHYLQDGSAPSFEMLRSRKLRARVPQRAFAVADHYVPTDSRDLATMKDPENRAMAEALSRNARDAGARALTYMGLMPGEAPDEIDPFSKHYLIEGLDEIAYTLGQIEHVAAFERRYEK